MNAINDREKNKQIINVFKRHTCNAFFEFFINTIKNFQTKTIFAKTHCQFNKSYIDQKNKFINKKITFENFSKKYVVMKKFIQTINKINIYL